MSVRQFSWLLAAVISLHGWDAAHTFAQDQGVEATEAQTVLYSFPGLIIKDSKWGKIAAFQQALSDQLKACGKTEVAQTVKSDGVFGKKSKEAIIALTSCLGFERFAAPSNSPLNGAITVGLWKKLLPNTPLPTAQERALAISLSYEDTDYDRAEWNFIEKDGKVMPQPNDSLSCLTWGPYGATLGHGGEVSAILKLVQGKNPSLLEEVFGAELPVLINVMNKPPKDCVGLLLDNVFALREKRKFWKEKFQTLGARPEVRAAYEAYAWQSNAWLKPNLKRMYAGFFANDSARSQATEIDFAFFSDLAMHMSITPRRIAKATAAIVEKEKALARPLTPAERRRVIGTTMVPSGQQRDRMGRNVVFFVDGIGESNLSKEEREAWIARGKRKASNCGLSDSRVYFPPFLN